jgi:hypothetical protein
MLAGDIIKAGFLSSGASYAIAFEFLLKNA